MARAKRICPKRGCPDTVLTRYCAKHEQEYERQRGNSSQRGYGYAHQARRRNTDKEVQRGNVQCVLCGKPIHPGTPWHLDHTEDRTAYRGPAHEACNTSDGGKRAHQTM